jgi:hypothetical protein
VTARSFLALVIAALLAAGAAGAEERSVKKIVVNLPFEEIIDDIFAAVEEEAKAKGKGK